MFRRVLKVHILRNITRKYGQVTANRPLILEKISQRSALKVKGSDAESFLQGLITNDMSHLKNSSSAMYTMFLNSKGRVLADSIIYRTPEENTYLIEIDSAFVSSLEKHLASYILRKKIEVFNLESILTLWVLFDPDSPYRDDLHPKIKEILARHKNPSKLICSHALYEDIVFIYKDPRSLQLGLRILTSTDVGTDTIREKLDWNDGQISTSAHRSLRYKLGVGEGVLELPPGKCFPLEANCDYLHGISFQKGCYLGQELTARTYHTGVIRKRLMPLIFTANDDNFVDVQQPILINHDKSIVGKLRAVQDNYGLGLLRIENALKHNDLCVGGLRAVTVRPSWWPVEAPKEVVKTEIKIEEPEMVKSEEVKSENEIKKDVTPENV